jgi:hypothetical protein
MKTRIQRAHVTAATICAIGLCGLLLGFQSSAASGSADQVSHEMLSRQIATLFRSARGVISDNQELINDASKGDKGLSPEVVIEAAKAKFETANGSALPASDTGSLDDEARKAMLAAITKVMTDAQPLINEQGKGFKGFLPAVFGKQVADNFSERMDGKMFIKLTAPKAYVRNRANRPDEWETSVIETKFKGSEWKNGEAFFENSAVKGRDAFRLIIPEYYAESCLKCHGDPKGEVDITGGKKEGGKLGELGGAISIGVYSDSAIAAGGQ